MTAGSKRIQTIQGHYAKENGVIYGSAREWVDSRN